MVEQLSFPIELRIMKWSSGLARIAPYLALLELVSWVGFPARIAAQDEIPAPDTTDIILVEILASAISIAEGEIWPGYGLDDISILAYRPDTWAILVSPGTPNPKEWQPYPKAWPALTRPAVFHTGGVGGLVGQLSFDYEVAGRRTVAVPLFAQIPPEVGERNRQLFAFLTHEAFHQYQRRAFGELDTPPEEAYPLLNVHNNALAMLELRAMEDALHGILSGDRDALGRAARRAAAIHRTRQATLAPEARALERAKEIVEGTAKYVEARSIEQLALECEAVSARKHNPELCDQFDGETAAGWLVAEMERRFKGNAVDPRDMPRNRIYPLAASLGLVLDHYDPQWKTLVEREGTSADLFAQLSHALQPEAPDEELLAEGKAEYGWSAIVEASRDKVATYERGFQDALTAFESRPGRRMVIELPRSGFERSRSSRGEIWVMEEGRRTLGLFTTYSLRRRGEAPLTLSIRDRVVMDEMRAPGRRRLSLILPDTLTVSVNGRDMTLDGDTQPTKFNRLELRAGNVTLHAEAHGEISGDGTVHVRFYE